MLHIILVEDNDADAMFFQRAVEETALPTEVVVLTSGVKVIEYLTVGNVSIGRPLILIDLDLPVMTGLEFLVR